jgi:hypothetical protein
MKDWLYRLALRVFPLLPDPAPGQPHLKWLAFKRQDIMDFDHPGELYLRRFMLCRTPLGGLYIHEIVRPDNDRCLHDHPWNFTSLILAGGYWEETFVFDAKDRAKATHPNSVYLTRMKMWYGPGSFRYMDAAHTHRVLMDEGKKTWSLCFVSGKKKSWGFWKGAVFTPWREFFQGDREC